MQPILEAGALTERSRSTTLTLEQARQIFLKWVKIFQEQRRAKADKAEPTEEVVAEGTGATSSDYRNAVLDHVLASAGWHLVASDLEWALEPVRIRHG